MNAIFQGQLKQEPTSNPEFQAIFDKSKAKAEEEIRFAELIDLTPLMMFAEKHLGAYFEMDVMEVRHVRGTTFIEFHSKNAINDAGIFKAAFSEVRLASVSGGVRRNKDDHETLPNVMQAWFSVDLRYAHHGGGTNGASVFTAIFGDYKWEMYAQSKLVETIYITNTNQFAEFEPKS
jgi:hypothetical protein